MMLIPTATLSADESYLRIGDMATSFSSDKRMKAWSIARFNTEGSKYVVVNQTRTTSPRQARRSLGLSERWATKESKRIARGTS